MSLPSKIQIGDYAGHDVQSLADQPGMSAAELKTVFDYVSEQVVVPKVNAIIDGLKSATAGDSGGKCIVLPTIPGIPGNDVETAIAFIGNLLNTNGWSTLPACSFVSADLPTSTFVVNVTGDVTGYIRPSTKLKLTQGSNTLYFIVHAVGAYVGGVTPVTLFGGSTNTTVNIGASGMTSGSPSLVVSSTTGFLAGMLIYGDGVPAGTTVLFVTDATHLVMSANATKTQTSAGTVTVIIPAYNLLSNPVTNPITNPFYGQGKPQGFPVDPTVWEIKIICALDCAKTSPANGAWYGDTALSSAGPSISVPVGIFDVSYEGIGFSNASSAAVLSVYFTLSTSTSSESDTDFSSTYQINTGLFFRQTLMRKKTVNLTAKTLYYLIIGTVHTPSSISINGLSKPTILRARSALL